LKRQGRNNTDSVATTSSATFVADFSLGSPSARPPTACGCLRLRKTADPLFQDNLLAC
jgi:hypothetical protein